MYAHFKNSLGLKAETFFLTSQVENVAFAIRKLNFIQCAVQSQTTFSYDSALSQATLSLTFCNVWATF